MPSGRGEDARCTFRALRSVAQEAGVLDIYGLHEPVPATHRDIQASQVKEPGGINIFHINGDEVDQVFSHLQMNKYRSSYNVIYPAWELSRYPAEWAQKLDLFDEIWAPTHFIADSISPAVNRPVFHMPFASEVLLSRLLGRRYFGVPEQHFLFLFFFDFRSYIQRKNPLAVIDSFKRVMKSRPAAAASLVIKISGAEQAPEAYAQLLSAVEELRQNVVLIDRQMDDDEIKNLIRCADCFVSLHRSEGFGRGLAEAMYLGKPVIGTAYSGNMDFMTEENSLLIPYSLTPLQAGDYPFWSGQVWAEPDLDSAVAAMISLIDRPGYGIALGKRASADLRSNFSYRKIGLAYRQRIARIESEISLAQALLKDAS